MSAEQDESYIPSRASALFYVWRSLANEYDFLIDVKPVAQWDRFFYIIEENDPARHLKSIHNGEETMNFGSSQAVDRSRLHPELERLAHRRLAARVDEADRQNRRTRIRR